jgi:N-methylhydantoinase B/oxoprolinase/acetone carboxylase alpha subunit
MTGTDATIMHPGDVFVLETPGGGGFGLPVAQRQPAAGIVTKV